MKKGICDFVLIFAGQCIYEWAQPTQTSGHQYTADGGQEDTSAGADPQYVETSSSYGAFHKVKPSKVLLRSSNLSRIRRLEVRT
jgi:hypothetical protein